MNRLRRIVLVAAVAGLLVGERPAAAVDFGLGLFKRRQAKADVPQSRAKQLVEILRTDPDEDKRIAAATELKGLDPRNNPEIIPGLMASLQKDPSPAVRIEAVKALGDLKPVSEPAGLAMEAARASDPDAKVVEAIRKSLFQYHLNGYRTPESGSPFATETDTPGSKRPAVKPTLGFQPIKNSIGKALPTLLTAEPPLAPPKPKFPAVPPAPTVAPAPTLAPQDLPKGAPQPMPTTRPVEALPVSRVKAVPTVPTVPVPTPPVPTPTVGGLPPLVIPQVDVPAPPAGGKF